MYKRQNTPTAFYRGTCLIVTTRFLWIIITERAAAVLDVMSVRFGLANVAPHHPFKYKTTAADKTILMWRRGINYSQDKPGNDGGSRRRWTEVPSKHLEPWKRVVRWRGSAGAMRGSVDVALRKFGKWTSKKRLKRVSARRGGLRSKLGFV